MNDPCSPLASGALADNRLERDGRMSAAIAGIDRGNEGIPFALGLA